MFLELSNLIGGKDLVLSGKRFGVQSTFYPDYSTIVPDSSLFDVKTAIFKARAAWAECASLDFDQRMKILALAAKNLSFSNEDFECIVKYTGAPISRVKQMLEQIPPTLNGLLALIEKRVGAERGFFSQAPVSGRSLIHVFQPIEGFVYAVTPGNDPRVSAFVAAWCACLGIPCILKPAKTDLKNTLNAAKAIVGAGYPAGGVQVLCWDTSRPKNASLNFELVDASAAVWAFGNTDTIDRLLRFEEKNSHAIDHFSGKIVLRHSTGRTACIVDEGHGEKRIAAILASSSFDWPIGCNALKAVFCVEKEYEELKAALLEEVKKLEKFVGDPMKASTRVGYCEPENISHAFGRAEKLGRLGMASTISGKIVSKMQSTPLLLEVFDKNNDFTTTEISAYILALKKCASFEQATAELNETAGKERRLCASVFSSKPRDSLLKKLRLLKAHHIKLNKPTTELDLLYHEGNDYLHRLTVPQLHA